jgi:hypothetical protein
MQKVALPGWCLILDELTSESAKERDLDVSEARIGVRKKMAREKRGRGCCAAKLASTPTSDVVSTRQK